MDSNKQVGRLKNEGGVLDMSKKKRLDDLKSRIRKVFGVKKIEMQAKFMSRCAVEKGIFL